MITMRRFAWLLTGLVIAFSLGVTRQPTNANNSDVTGNDSRLLSKLHEVYGAEIDRVRMAHDKTMSVDLKRLADRAIRDFQAADQKLLAAAKDEGLTVGAFEPADSAESDMIRDQLHRWDFIRSMVGADFDKAFVLGLQNDYGDLIDVLETEGRSAKSARVADVLAKWADIFREDYLLAVKGEDRLR